MEKNWFIFKGDHHLGPFSSEDLVRMLQHDKAKPDDLIWREGEADWLPMKSHPALLAYFEPRTVQTPTAPAKEEFVLREPVIEDELPPPLPPLPVEELVEELVEEEDDFWAEDLGDVTEKESLVEPEVEDELPPPLPPLPVFEEEMSALEPELEEMPLSEPELEEMPLPEPELEEMPLPAPVSQIDEKLIFDDFKIDHDEDSLDEEEDDDVTRDDILVPDDGLWEEAPAWQRYSMIASLFIGLLMSLYFFNWDGEDVEGTLFSGISGARKRELIKITNTSPKLGIKAQLALSNTGNEIWLATNQPGEATVYLSLKSIDDKVLTEGSGDIILRSIGELVKGGAKFRNIELVAGSQMAEGHYEANIVGYATGWKSRLANYLKKYTWGKTLKFVKRFEPEFKLNVPFLFSIKPPTEFDRLLSENMKKQKLDLARPYQEIMERHKTFSSLLANIQQLYKDSLEKMNKGSDVRLFERRYAMEIEPILRDLLLDSNRQHIALMNSDKRRSEDYLKLVDEGKEIGILVSDIVTRTRKYGKLTDKKREKLAGIFAPRIEEIQKISKEDVLRLESEMKRILAD